MDNSHQEVVYQTVNKGNKKGERGDTCLIMRLKDFDSVDIVANLYNDVSYYDLVPVVCVLPNLTIQYISCSVFYLSAVLVILLVARDIVTSPQDRDCDCAQC